MDLKSFFAKKLLFQNSLNDDDIWTNEKFESFKEIPASPSNEEAMLGFIRHITVFTHEQKDYLSNQVSIPVGIQQKCQLQLEAALSDLWSVTSTDSQSTQRSIANQPTSTFPEVNLLTPLLETLISDHSMDSREITSSKIKDKRIIAESHVINLFARHLVNHLSSYEELIDYLFSNKKFESIVVDEKYNRYFVLFSKG